MIPQFLDNASKLILIPKPLLNYEQHAQSMWPHDLTKVEDITGELGESPSRRRQDESGGLTPSHQRIYPLTHSLWFSRKKQLPTVKNSYPP